MAKAALLDFLCELRHCGLHRFGRTTASQQSPRTAWILTIVIMQVLSLMGSTIAGAKGADQEYVVDVAFKYKAGERASHGWRAFLTALDKCHAQGYRDAYLVGDPKSPANTRLGTNVLYSSLPLPMIALEWDTNPNKRIFLAFWNFDLLPPH
jgi:hypothetical protein